MVLWYYGRGYHTPHKTVTGDPYLIQKKLKGKRSSEDMKQATKYYIHAEKYGKSLFYKFFSCLKSEIIKPRLRRSDK
jgi:hypothetical protein